MSEFLNSSNEMNVTSRPQLRIGWSLNLWKAEDKPHKSLGDAILQFGIYLHVYWRTRSGQITEINRSRNNDLLIDGKILIYLDPTVGRQSLPLKTPMEPARDPLRRTPSSPLPSFHLWRAIPRLLLSFAALASSEEAAPGEGMALEVLDRRCGGLEGNLEGWHKGEEGSGGRPRGIRGVAARVKGVGRPPSHGPLKASPQGLQSLGLEAQGPNPPQILNF